MKQPQPPTRSGLLPEARHLVLPKGIVSSGFPSVRETCRRIGIEFDPWQVDLNRCILAKTADGLFAADTVAISIPRQVGKTFDIGAVVFALCIANADTTVIWTAHRFKVSRETFNELRSLARSPKLAPHIDFDAITTAAGNECIPFRNGSRIVFAARERGAIRGFTKVRILILDEAQILTEAALADLAPTMNQAENPLIILMGTPPKPGDPAEVFSNLRAEALAGDSEGVLYIELSAEPGSDPNDRSLWPVFNPSYPKRTGARAILRLKKLLTPEDFDREARGIWDGDGPQAVISSADWAARKDSGSQVVGSATFALDVSPKMTHSAVAFAGFRADGDVHGELLHREGQDILDYRPGTDWVLPALVDLKTRVPDLRVSIIKGSQAETLVPELEDAGIPVDRVAVSEFAAACGLVFKLATTGGLWHIGQPQLTAAVAATKWRDVGEGAQAWGRKKSTSDITPFIAFTLAIHQAQSAKYDVLASFY